MLVPINHFSTWTLVFANRTDVCKVTTYKNMHKARRSICITCSMYASVQIISTPCLKKKLCQCYFLN